MKMFSLEIPTQAFFFVSKSGFTIDNQPVGVFNVHVRR